MWWQSGKCLVIHEVVVDIAAVGLQIGGVEDRVKDLLDLLHVFTDADLRAGLGHDLGRAGEAVGGEAFEVGASPGRVRVID